MRKIDTTLNVQRKVFLTILFTGMCVIVGPFGTYASMSAMERVLFWATDTIVCLITMQMMVSFIFSQSVFNHLNDFILLSLAALLSTILNYGFILQLTNFVSPTAMDATPPLKFLFELTTTMHVMLFVEFVLWDRITNPAPALTTTEAPLGEPLRFADTNLAQRVPAKFANSDLYAVSMEDHYAVIQTSKGEHRVLMRLKDAIDLLEGLPGLQVHRSHWVPINAMIALHKEQRKYLLEIKSGKSIPVSQSYLEAVQSILK